MATDALINKYRPADFDQIVGHDAVMAALQRSLEAETRSHAFLLTGPAGIGKTTTARIIANHLQAQADEIDAASNSGVDAMRSLVESSHYMSLSGAGRRMIIIDECHALSRPAWQAILKLLEEPPEHLFLALCTTEKAKVPETIQTRCYPVVLRALPAPDIEDLLTAVADLEEWQVHPDVFQMIVRGATGQPRKALSMLQAVHDAPSAAEASRIVDLMEATNPVIELLQHLTAGKRSWPIIRGLLNKLDDESIDDALVGGSRYILAVLMNSEDEAKASRLWALIEALVFPAATYDKKLAFVAAIGRYLWSK
jgi:DNA polymerase-3 subunit gamma/tau